MRTLLVIVVLVLVASGLPRAALADETAEDRALATSLFNEAKALLDKGEVARACPKLAESQRLHPAGGTLLNLAVCHEKEGKTATAWSEFRDARALAVRDQRDDRVEVADAHLAVLAEKIPRITINVIGGGAAAIVLDGRSMAGAVLGTAIPVDPGEHVVEANAEKKMPFRTEIYLSEGSSITLTIPELEDAALVVVENPLPQRRLPRVTHEAPRRRTAAIVTASVGAALVGVGSAFGVIAIGQHDDAKTVCINAGPCDMTPASLNDSAKTSADVATVLIGTGVIALGVGAYLWFSSSR